MSTLFFGPDELANVVSFIAAGGPYCHRDALRIYLRIAADYSVYNASAYQGRYHEPIVSVVPHTEHAIAAKLPRVADAARAVATAVLLAYNLDDFCGDPQGARRGPHARRRRAPRAPKERPPRPGVMPLARRRVTGQAISAGCSPRRPCPAGRLFTPRGAGSQSSRPFPALSGRAESGSRPPAGAPPRRGRAKRSAWMPASPPVVRVGNGGVCKHATRSDDGAVASCPRRSHACVAEKRRAFEGCVPSPATLSTRRDAL